MQSVLSAESPFPKTTILSSAPTVALPIIGSVNWEPPAGSKSESGTPVKCPRCGAENPEDGIFCSSCGARLAGQAQTGNGNPPPFHQRPPFGGGIPPYGIPYGDSYGGANPDEEMGRPDRLILKKLDKK